MSNIYDFEYKYDTKEICILKVCEDFPNYCVSPFGEVFNIKTGRRIKQQIYSTNHNEYKRCRVGLRKNNKSYNVYVHQLVARAFVYNSGYNPDNTPFEGSIQVNHKDHDTLNNNKDNLEWCDARYNQRHRRNK